MSDTLHLGGFTAIALFVTTLVASVVQSAITQHVQVSLGFRQPFFLFYIAHSLFTVVLPLHLLYLKFTTHQSATSHFKRTIAMLRYRLAPASEQPRSFPIKRLLVLLLYLTAGLTVPSVLWYIAVSVAPISGVTAIWHTDAFWTYLLNVRMHNAKIQIPKLSAVFLACVGVLFVVYGGQSASHGLPVSPQSTSTTNPDATNGGSAALIGDLLTLIASIVNAAYQVLYNRFVSLPSDSDGFNSAPVLLPQTPISPTRAGYQPLSTDDEAFLLSPHSPDTPSSASDGSTLPFGLYPNLLTSGIGAVTLIALWPVLVFLHWTGAEPFTLPADGRTWAGIAGIALGEVIFNSGFMVLLGIWGPVLSSVGNLLTIVLMLLMDVFLMAGGLLTGWSILGCGMIAGGFGVLAWDVVRETAGLSEIGPLARLRASHSKLPGVRSIGATVTVVGG